MQFKVPEIADAKETYVAAWKIQLACKVHTIHGRCWILGINPSTS